MNGHDRKRVKIGTDSSSTSALPVDFFDKNNDEDEEWEQFKRELATESSTDHQRPTSTSANATIEAAPVPSKQIDDGGHEQTKEQEPEQEKESPEDDDENDDQLQAIEEEKQQELQTRLDRMRKLKADHEALAKHPKIQEAEHTNESDSDDEDAYDAESDIFR